MNEIKITNAERMIIEVIWQYGELSNGDIVNIINEQTEWSRHTVKTYTNSLLKKGLLGMNQESPRKIRYFPLITKEKFLALTTGSHLRKNYSKLSYMIAGLINNEVITDDEIDELEKLIKEYKER